MPFLRNSILAAVLAAALSCPADAGDWEFASSAGYETGKFGTGGRVDAVSLPFTLTRSFADSRLSATVPLARLSSTGRVTFVGGRPERVAGDGAPASGPAEGAGDVLVRGAYVVTRDGPGSFGLSIGGKLKLPTANEKKGLGTGELDQGAGFEFSKELTPRLRLLADGYYTIIGDPAGLDFNNRVSLALGFDRPVGAGLKLTVLYETASALLDGADDPRGLSAALSGGRGGAGLNGGLFFGLSEGSPALGVSAGLSLGF